jgi:hypothetical protein
VETPSIYFIFNLSGGSKCEVFVFSCSHLSNHLYAFLVQSKTSFVLSEKIINISHEDVFTNFLKSTYLDNKFSNGQSTFLPLFPFLFLVI